MSRGQLGGKCKDVWLSKDTRISTPLKSSKLSMAGYRVWKEVLEDIGLEGLRPDLNRSAVNFIKLLLDFILHVKCFEKPWSFSVFDQLCILKELLWL